MYHINTHSFPHRKLPRNQSLPWSTKDINYLILNHELITHRVLARTFGRSLNSVRAKIHNLRKEGLIPNRLDTTV